MTGVSDSLCIPGIMSATGNGYVIYMTIKRKTKLKPPELMTVNLAIFDFGISGMGLCMLLLQNLLIRYPSKLLSNRDFSLYKKSLYHL